MKRLFLFVSFISLLTNTFSQETSFSKLLNDSAMVHASMSICIIDPSTGKTVSEYDSQRSLTPASVMKLITTAAALELLGPDYKFKTTIGFTGNIDKTTKTLKGDIIIKGGGDPCLGSENFENHYGDFISRWADEIIKAGIRKIEGQVITDDSFYNYEPVPSKWLWEDMGNYYGAGVYGLSIFDNYYSVHLSTSKAGSKPEITGITPTLVSSEITNLLVSGGTRDEGYVFAAPYSSNTRISGIVPENKKEFDLKASISDPPLLAAKLLHEKLLASGVMIVGEPSTKRILGGDGKYEIVKITETESPALSEIINVLNLESVNLYAESLTKQLGLVFKKSGSTEAGIAVINEFLNRAGVKTDGITIVDGSGLSPSSRLTSEALARVLLYMKNNSRNFNYYLESLPVAGETGTLKNYFTNPVFKNRLRMKSGSMSGIRSYTGYVTANSGKEIIVAIIINNFTGSSEKIIPDVEYVVQHIIENN